VDPDKEKLKVLVVGSTGFLGREIVTGFRAAGVEVLEAARRPAPGGIVLDLENFDANDLARRLKDLNIVFGLICAGMTKLDECFLEREKSRKVNVEGTTRLLEVLKSCNITPVFFSSDNVFAGTKPDYTENSLRNPRSVYGGQKLEIEDWMQSHLERYLIIRTSKLVSLKPDRLNPLAQQCESLMKGDVNRVAVDQRLNLLLIEDVAAAMLALLRAGLNGVFHMATLKAVSRYELAQKINERLPSAPGKLEAIKIGELKLLEPRSKWSTISSAKIRAALPEIRFRELDEFLSEFIKIYLDRSRDSVV
jgi:dTDP-4-dehydrorhamnose reductase